MQGATAISFSSRLQARLLLTTLMACASFAALSSAQGKGATKEASDDDGMVTTRVGAVRIIDSKEASPLAKTLISKAIGKPAKKKPAPMLIGAVVSPDREEALRAVARVRHSSFVPALKRVLQNAGEERVRVLAAEALLAQEPKLALPVALDCVAEKELQKSGPVSAMLVRCASALGADAKAWSRIYGLFVDLEPEAQIEICDHIAAVKDWDAIELLLQNLGEPAPKDVHAANNPPVDYWKRRWDKWRAFRPRLQSALRALLGKSFETEKDARAHIEAQGGLDKLRKLSDRESSGSRR